MKLSKGELYTGRNYRQNESIFRNVHDTLESDMMTELKRGKLPKVTLSSLFHWPHPSFLVSYFSSMSLCPFTHAVSQFLIFYHHLSRCHSVHSPVVVNVGGCHCVAEVGPHLERITNKTQLACNHTTVHRSLSFLSFSFSVYFFPLLCPPTPPPEAFLFNLSIPQSPGVSSSPFSWSSVLELL